MPKAHATVLAGLGAVLVTGAAPAASRDAHTLDVSLPDGSAARIEYVGDIPPKVILTPPPLSDRAIPLIFDRSALDLDRQIGAMIGQISRVMARPITGVPGLNVAAYSGAPAGSTSVTVVSTSNGTRTCTRTTEVRSEGPRRPPKVLSSASGGCSVPYAAPNGSNPT